MSYFSKKDYQFIKFEKAKNNKKKYSAIIKNKTTGRTKKINFRKSMTKKHFYFYFIYVIYNKKWKTF